MRIRCSGVRSEDLRKGLDVRVGELQQPVEGFGNYFWTVKERRGRTMIEGHRHPRATKWGVLARALFLLLPISLALMVGCKSRSDSTSSFAGEAARSKPYVASAAREPFHRADCQWAKKINADNLVGYDTREAAIKDGKRPCGVCKP